MEKNEVELNENGNFLNFKEAFELLKTEKPVNFLWSGIKESSFGLIFGPSKSGKTIFCENLALSFAVGKDEFMEYPIINPEPKKVMFVGLEEFWMNRIERNSKQYEFLSDEEKELYQYNFFIRKLDFPKSVVTKESWSLLRDTIKESETKIVFIDSITRLNHGKIEDGKVAEEICLNLRNISQELNVTIIAIHHTPKLGDEELSMDKIKGSSVFSQETDFAIGINRTNNGSRYMQNIYFRYADDSDKTIQNFSFNESLIVESLESNEFIHRDRRISEHREFILGLFKENPTKEFHKSEIDEFCSSELGIKERQVYKYLNSLLKLKEISNPKKGYYSLTEKVS